MGKIENFNFRQLAGKYVLLKGIHQNRFRLYNTEFQCLEGDNALLTYGYIDHEAGLSFEVLCFVKCESEKSIELRPGNDRTTFKIRYDEMIGDIHVRRSAYLISMLETMPVFML